MFEREHGVTMVEDMAHRLKYRCPEGCGRHSNLDHMELEILTGRYDRWVGMAESRDGRYI